MLETVARSIPFFNYAGAFSANEGAYLSILSDIIRRGAFIQQRDLVNFEAHLADYVQVKHAIGVGNATDGLMMIFRALGVGAGDEVIFPRIRWLRLLLLRHTAGPRRFRLKWVTII